MVGWGGVEVFEKVSQSCLASSTNATNQQAQLNGYAAAGALCYLLLLPRLLFADSQVAVHTTGLKYIMLAKSNLMLLRAKPHEYKLMVGVLVRLSFTQQQQGCHPYTSNLVTNTVSVLPARQ